MWKGPKEFFTYTKNQRNGIVLLLGLVIAFFAIQLFWDFRQEEEFLDTREFEKQIVEWETANAQMAKKEFQENLFSFDPNTVSRSDLKKLGMASHQIAVLINFRSKGGVFKNPDDLFKIYGIDSNWVYSVKEFVHIQKQLPKNHYPQLSLSPFNPNTVLKDQLLEMGFSHSQAKGFLAYRKGLGKFKSVSDIYKVYSLDSSFVQNIKSYLIFEEKDSLDLKEVVQKKNLNELDTLQIYKIQGIPTFLLKRIIKYRNQLGGYYSLDQLWEIYGMDDKIYQSLIEQVYVDQGFIVPMNVNELGFKELLKHPYLNFEQVKSIVNFRKKVRPFNSIDELNELELINDSLFTKIANYLEVGKK
tara:strand:- start:51 stop:1124 length:1074 start_codon:yes stop_codon:yes gene_type:complete